MGEKKEKGYERKTNDERKEKTKPHTQGEKPMNGIVKVEGEDRMKERTQTL